MTPGSELRISELLTARLCHELVGPITAVANGADLLSEDGVEVDREALTLVGESARRAGNRLQFYRFAYGFGGDGHAAGQPPCDLADGYFAASRIVCRYGETVRSLPLVQQKLACNLLVFAAEALTRGGVVTLDAAECGLRLSAAGDAVCLTREQAEALALAPPVAQLTSRTVHAYFTGLLARAQGWRLLAMPTPGRLAIASVAAAL
jgi:histidine phosphotransferase ChpT